MTSRLRALLEPVGVVVDDSATEPVSTSEQVHLRWENTPQVTRLQTAVAKSEKRGGLSFVARIINRSSLPRRRALDLAPDRILVVGVDADSRLRNWAVIQDPRIIRAEIAGPDGRLSGGEILRPDADFFVDLPAADGVAEIRIYKAVWNGQDFDLVLLSAVSIE